MIPAAEPSRSGYMFTVARHACFDLMRRRKRLCFIEDIDHERHERESAFGGQAAERLPEAHLVAGCDRDVLYEALRQLPERHRRALVLREVCDLTYDEIAADLGLNRNAVAQLLSRARAALTRQVSSAGNLSALAPA